MKLHLETVGLFVNNMELMVKFYRDVMKLNIDWDGGCFTGVKTDCGVIFVICERRIMEEDKLETLTYPKGINGTMELCFGVDTPDEVDKEFERLINSGARLVYRPKTEAYGMRTCFVADPEGNLIEICAGVDD